MIDDYMIEEGAFGLAFVQTLSRTPSLFNHVIINHVLHYCFTFSGAFKC